MDSFLLRSRKAYAYRLEALLLQLHARLLAPIGRL
jgi:hypothetical protein